MNWNDIVQTILGVGSTVLIPIFIAILGLIFGMKLSKAVLSGLYLGTGFIGMSLAINQLTAAVSPAAKALAKNTGINLPVVDFGWTGASAITWAWPLAFAFFAIELGINLVMLLGKMTKTLNADMWNVWGIALTGYIVYQFSGNMLWGFVVAGIQVVISLKLGDMWSEEIKDMLGYEGVTVTHIETFTAVIMSPVNKLMDFIPVFNKEWDADALKRKIGIMSEPVVMGALIGLLLGIVGRYGIANSLNLAVTTGAVMAIFPVMAKFFMDALTPFGTTMSNFMKKHVKGREFVIGLDWPILGQSTELWVTMVLLIPVSIVFAAILPGNEILPLAGVINYCLGVGGLLLTGGNLLRMLVLGIIFEPLFLYSSTYFAGIFTKLAKSTGAINVPAGSEVSWSSIEAPDFRFLASWAGRGNILAIVGFIALLALFVLLYRAFQKNPIPAQKYKKQ
ncbi:galactitol-specific PTS system IIC component [Ligilactobacillus agilis]|uniref:Galactitol-specific PTS system IIC component n=1 Tax=Ligilactobacillus agilis TaxID=1601 RepID=A0A6F9YNQ2_9LACO|nr:PTS transporter subunit IIC [Ligilactobacillus agilis]GET06654.1 galactitol-specific PTS system IIC component [Ligilactobacillus agilis]GET18880.1 galactitol-specific PTS system IIC component [Ligilactobacillus agilis]